MSENRNIKYETLINIKVNVFVNNLIFFMKGKQLLKHTVLLYQKCI